MASALRRGLWTCLEEVILQFSGDGIGFKAGARLQALRLADRRACGPVRGGGEQDVWPLVLTLFKHTSPGEKSCKVC